MAPTSILVIGAGELGNEVLQSLATHPDRGETGIAVLVRPATISSDDEAKRESIEHLRGLNFDIVAGDIVENSIEQLTTTFSRFHTVINCSGMFLPSGTQTRVLKAVVASDCARYFPWQFGVDYDAIGRNSSQDLFTEQLGVRDILRGQSNVKFVIVSTGMFISFIFEPAFDIVNAERSRVTALGSWDNKITVTSPRDIGRLTAEIALAHSNINDVVYVAGDTVSMQDIADIVDKVCHTEVERRLKTVDQLKDELADDSSDGMRKYRCVFAEGVGIAWDKTTTFNAKHGIETETVELWASRGGI